MRGRAVVAYINTVERIGERAEAYELLAHLTRCWQRGYVLLHLAGFRP